MATQPATQAETGQASQEAIAALMLAPLRQAWGLLDVNRLEETLPLFRDAIRALVDYYGRAAAATAVQHFRAVRFAAGVPGKADVAVALDAPEGFVDQLVVESVARAVENDLTGARDSLDAGAEQLVLDQGRRQVMSAAALDREAKGWARVPNAGACSFCLMLSLRAGAGLLYTSRASASFKAHDNCRCTAEPVFTNYEPPARVREAQRVWAESTKGRSGHDARVAFRQAVEGRPVTGAKDKGTTNKRGEKFTPAQGRTPENQRAQLRVLEAMPPAKTPEAAAWRTSRIAEIRKYLGK